MTTFLLHQKLKYKIFSFCFKNIKFNIHKT